MSPPVENAQYNHNILKPMRGWGGISLHPPELVSVTKQESSSSWVSLFRQPGLRWPPLALAGPQECVGQCGLQWPGSPERVRLIDRACFGGWGEQNGKPAKGQRRGEKKKRFNLQEKENSEARRERKREREKETIDREDSESRNKTEHRRRRDQSRDVGTV
ncbi:R-spondin-3 [Anabarilius grahami]|uniref:R-spondin-3 n=1 Tax=Anabarilius grahami TaxID=495550 RepID=A0A3N0YD28_ANAGA|nr:R-spondin-3 [Anabarilius grahami]